MEKINYTITVEYCDVCKRKKGKHRAQTLACPVNSSKKIPLYSPTNKFILGKTREKTIK